MQITQEQNRFLNCVTGRSIEPDPVWAPMDIAFVMCFPSIAGFSTKSSLAGAATVMTMDARKSKNVWSMSKTKTRKIFMVDVFPVVELRT